VGCFGECGAGEGTCDLYAEDTMWSWLVDLNTANFGGHNDWRIPTREELVSIVDYAGAVSPVVDATFHRASCGGACIDVTDPSCSCTASSDWYWTASTCNVSCGAWLVRFDYGYVESFPQAYGRYVRAVRGGS